MPTRRSALARRVAPASGTRRVNCRCSVVTNNAFDSPEMADAEDDQAIIEAMMDAAPAAFASLSP